MTQVYRLCSSSYRGFPSENSVHSQLLIHVSSPSTTNNEGGGWVATGPLGLTSGFSFSDYVESDNSTKRPVNRALVADDSIFYLTGDRLFKLNYTATQSAIDGFIGNNWNIIHTFTQVEAGRTGRTTGIYSCLVDVSGTLSRCIVGSWNSTSDGANSWRGFRYNIDSRTIDISSAADLSFAATPSTGAVKAEILYENKLYFIGATDGGVATFDPQTMQFLARTWPTSDIWGPHDFCPYKGNLYCLNRGERGGGGGSGIYIWRVNDGPTLAFNAAVNGYGISSFGSEPLEGRSVLFTDRTFLYAGQTTEVNGANAFRFLRMGTDISGAFYFDGVMPLLAQADATVRANFFTEQNTNPDILGDGYDAPNGQLMTLMIDNAGATGVGRAQYAWVGPSTSSFLEEVTGGNILHTLRETARSHCKSGGGERIWDPLYGGPRVDITSIASSGASLKVTYKMFNNPYDFPAGTPCAIQLKWEIDGHMPCHRGRIFNQDTGALRENNTVLVVTSESGSQHSFNWDYASSNLDASHRPNINLYISTTGVL